jgi:hypothetical protein
MQSDTMRDNGEKCLLLAEKHSTHEPTRLRYMRMAAAWQDLADFQDWLDGQKRNAAAVLAGVPRAA